METTGIGNLVDYGVLGIVVLACFAVIIWLAKKQESSIKTIVEDKDKQIGDWKHSAEKRDEQIDGVLSQLNETSKQQAGNSKILITLYERMQTSIDTIPEKTADKIRLLSK